MSLTRDPAAAPRELHATGTRPAKFAHIVLRTPNYQAMRAYYATFLQAQAAFENELLTFLRYDDEHHRIVLVNIPPLELETDIKAGVEHFAYSYDTLGDLLGHYLYLKEHGIEPCWCINHGMTTSIYYADPDGNTIETQYDNFDVAGADAFMRDGYFAKNPIGVDFDPERLIERYRNGDPIEELVRQGSAPPPPGIVPPRPRAVPPYDYRGELL
jgi:catechol 2,3-dioxygenase-like lactoylglutathione lyase family enzyme